MRSDMQDNPGRVSFTELGTAATIDLTQAFGGLPTRNFQQGQFEHYENLNGTTIKETRMVANKACFACTIACGRVTRLGEHSGKYLVNMHPRNWKPAGEGPEYENAWALGADCGVGDLDAVLKANWLCNDLGLDPISMGASLAAAMELYERGVIGDADVELPLRFGSAEALVRMVEATGYREGFGNEIAEGSKRMGEKFRHPEVFMGVKGQEFPAYDPRGFQGMGIAYATCNRGACHLRAWTPGIESSGEMDPHTPAGKSEWVVHEQNRSTAHDNTGVCMFVGAAGGPLESLVPCTAAATGVPYTLDDFVRIGERTWNLERLFNLKAGLTRCRRHAAAATAEGSAQERAVGRRRRQPRRDAPRVLPRARLVGGRRSDAGEAGRARPGVGLIRRDRPPARERIQRVGTQTMHHVIIGGGPAATNAIETIRRIRRRSIDHHARLRRAGAFPDGAAVLAGREASPKRTRTPETPRTSRGSMSQPGSASASSRSIRSARP